MQQHYSINDILAFEQRYRAMFINSLGGFKSLTLIGSVNENNQANLAIFSSFFHLGANPALFGIIVRPDSAQRHTLKNIMAVKEFTVNHVREDFYIKAHQTSARYPREVSEFEATGLNPEYVDGCRPPFVKESHVKFGARFVRSIDIVENGTTMVIASIDRVIVPDDCIGSDGFIDLEKAGSITCSGLDSYHKTTRIDRLSYAKPDTLPQSVQQKETKD
ncbi:MAG: flavin reductase family protein [Chitinophagaceae bacterium]|nr:MAG: flavin reductase family protein [Chitinophagaceae bacterium]